MRLTNEQRRDIVEKYKTGKYRIRSLAEEYNVTDGAISSLLKRVGVPTGAKYSPPRNRVSPLDKFSEEIIEKYKTGGYSYRKLGEEYSTCGRAIKRLLIKNGIKYSGTVKLTKEQINSIIKEYVEDNRTIKYLENKYNNKGIERHIFKSGVSRPTRQRQYSLNDNYFDSIDTEEKAYFLGLLYADGYNDENIGNIVIGLQEEDLDILNKFRAQLKTTKPLHYINHKIKYPTWKNHYKLTIYSRHMSEQLARLGCHQGKSLTLTFPTEKQVPKHLLKHFLRGVWDGDGSFGVYERSDCIKPIMSASMVSSVNFCQAVHEYISKNLDIKTRCYTKLCKDTTKSYSYIACSSTKHSYKFIKWLYENSNISLDRKYNRFLRCEKTLKETGKIK